ncbi:MAG: sodium:proton antiporter [Eubacteriales bacterium]|nr:sodium:proton antiporter [Eubacteriales bacterium]
MFINKLTVSTVVVFLTICNSATVFASGNGVVVTHSNIGEYLPVWSIIPFVGMLLSIAILPLVKPHFWEKNLLKVACFWSLLFLIPFGITFGGQLLTYQLLETVLLDYVPFIVLLLGLFTVTGGIVIKGSIVGTTKTNVVLLLIGTAIASWVGTTGAAMLMIRPVIRANAWREKKAHVVVFFIFMVANLGGCLTPIGDPPLFLGFLRGVPFFWTMKLLPLLLFNAAILLVVFTVIDRYYYKKEIAAGRSPKDMVVSDSEDKKIRIEGAHNFIFVLAIVGAVILSGTLPNFATFADQVTGQLHGIPIFGGIVFPYNSIVQIAIILIAAYLSMKTTRKSTRKLNEFTFAPIAEVAKIFIGIFITMIPALTLLRANGASLGISEPWQFFWTSGVLSSFLDNAPTYLVFMTMAGSLGFTEGLATTVGVIPESLLVAISAGAVFMGANTYIGNAPNFMVKSIAEENKVKMPSFFGYMGWSLCILIPILVLNTFIFF